MCPLKLKDNAGENYVKTWESRRVKTRTRQCLRIKYGQIRTWGCGEGNVSKGEWQGAANEGGGKALMV